VVVFQGRREDMSASAEAIDDAHREGVRFEFMAKPVGLQVREHAEDETALEAIGTMFDAEAAVASHPRVVGLACVRLQATSPASVGTKRPMSIPSSSFVIPADVLVTALGAEPQAEFLPPDPHARGYIVKTDPFGHTNREAVFAGGDVTGEPHTIAHSLGAGKRGAIGIDHLLRTRAGETTPALDARALCYGGTGSASITRWRGDDPVSRTNELNEVVPFSMLNMAYFEHEPMRHDRHAGAATAVAESNLGLAPEDALAEAKRCFNCGVCNDCDVCRVLCPDVAIKRHGGGPGYSLSYKYCKGCGLCVEECPRGAMTMTREGL
jgi:Pyruvate/2-oxoacid:ferredoxin oxidoreductase delta subunit